MKHIMIYTHENMCHDRYALTYGEDGGYAPLIRFNPSGIFQHACESVYCNIKAACNLPFYYN